MGSGRCTYLHTRIRFDRSERLSSGGCPTTTKEDQPDPIYQALWADTIDFNEVLISPVMVHDHMPDTVLRALNKVKIDFNSFRIH